MPESGLDCSVILEPAPELGAYTADMVVDAMASGNLPAFHVMDGGIITVNTDTAEALGIDYSVFKTMANTVTEVTTVE